jgi:polygalacturonase
MKKVILLYFLLFILFPLQAKIINISDFGAKGDGITDNTSIIQKAIDKCSETEGKVIIPSGKYLIHSLILKSNINLHLETGAILLGNTDLQSYLSVLKDTPALIFARDAENISITGHGTIDGQGWHTNFKFGDGMDGGVRRPKNIYFIDCRNITIQDITLTNPAEWTQYYKGCDGVIIRGIKVYSHANYNNDGLDIDSKNVIISDCYIDCDDDAICFKSDRKEPCQNIVVTNCILRSNCNAIKFGTSSFGGFKNIAVSNCMIQQASEDNLRRWHEKEPWMGTTDKTVISGIALESVDGGTMEQITISNIVMTDVQTPVFIRLGDRKRTFSNNISILKDILICNIIAEQASFIACSVTGVPEGIIDNVCIRDMQITSKGGITMRQTEIEVPLKTDAYPENRMFGVILPASCFYIRYAKNIRFENVKLRTLNTDTRPMFYLENTNEIKISECMKNNVDAQIVL